MLKNTGNQNTHSKGYFYPIPFFSSQAIIRFRVLHGWSSIMPKPRKQQVSVEATPYYHCVSRCVRQAFLCGTDSVSGQSYEHRRGWLEERSVAIQFLSYPKLPAIDMQQMIFHLIKVPGNQTTIFLPNKIPKPTIHMQPCALNKNWNSVKIPRNITPCNIINITNQRVCYCISTITLRRHNFRRINQFHNLQKRIIHSHPH
mgnify:CR=1 FL=1